MNTVPRIAIVDDDKACRTALGSLVRSLGYESCLFSCAEDFLVSQDISETDCLISDVHMPGMGGLDLQRSLVDVGRSIPTIFITAHPEESVRKRVLAAGAVCFLAKPYDAAVIIDWIEQALTKR